MSIYASTGALVWENLHEINYRLIGTHESDMIALLRLAKYVNLTLIDDP